MLSMDSSWHMIDENFLEYNVTRNLKFFTLVFFAHFILCHATLQLQMTFRLLELLYYVYLG